MRTLSVLLALAAILLAGAPASSLPPEEDPSPYRIEERASRQPNVGEKIYDAVVLRPFSFVQVVLSVPMLAVAYPVTLVTGGSDSVVRLCWTDPTERTFRRPLGQM